MMNYWHGIGNLCRDPESKTRSDGILSCRFSLAVNRRKNRETGQSTADYIPVRCSRVLAENCMKYLHKGSKVSVTGPIHTYSYDDQQGQKRFVVEVEATDIDFMPSAQQNSDGSQYQQGNVTQNDVGATDESGYTAVETDELPF